MKDRYGRCLGWGGTCKAFAEGTDRRCQMCRQRSRQGGPFSGETGVERVPDGVWSIHWEDDVWCWALDGELTYDAPPPGCVDPATETRS